MASVKEFVLRVVTGDAQKSISNVQSGLDDATAATGKLSGGFKKANFSVKAFGKALIATGIGAFVVAIGTLVNNLQNSEEGFNRVQKLMKQLGVITGNVTDIFYSLGTALFSLVTGDFEKMNKSFDEAISRIKNFNEETRREIDLQGELSDKTAELAKIERKLVVDRAEANRKRAELLEKSVDKERFTTAERIEFLKEAGRLEEEITNAEIEAAKLRLTIKEQENTLSESSAEDLEEEARLKAEVINLETARLTKQKEVTSQVIAFTNEERAAKKAASDEAAAQRKAEEDEFLAKEKEAADKELARLNSIDAIRKQFQQKIEDGEAETEAQKLELQKQRDLASLDALGATEAQKLEVKKYYAGLEAQLEKKKTDEEVALSEAVRQAKINDAQATLGQIVQLAGQGSAIGKAAALASATISGIEGVQNAYTTAQKSPITAVFPGYPIVQAGLAAAFSGLQIKSILSTPKPTVGGGAPSSSPRVPSAPATQPPSFNVVGASDTSQLAETIAGQQQKPVKAYVVSDDVSTAQALDRKIVKGASI